MSTFTPIIFVEILNLCANFTTGCWALAFGPHLRSSWKLLDISREADLSKSEETFSENYPSLRGAKNKILTSKWRNIFCAVYQRWRAVDVGKKTCRFKPSAIIIVSNDSYFFASWQMVHYGKFLFVPTRNSFLLSLSNRLRLWGFSLALMFSQKRKRNFDGFISGWKVRRIPFCRINFMTFDEASLLLCRKL